MLLSPGQKVCNSDMHLLEMVSSTNSNSARCETRRLLQENNPPVNPYAGIDGEEL